MTDQEIWEKDGTTFWVERAATAESRSTLVAYRPEAKIRNIGDPVVHRIIHPAKWNLMFSCGQGGHYNPVLVDLRSVQVRPTHFSIRHNGGCCTGMVGTDWNFEGSFDSENWDILKSYRRNKDLCRYWDEEEEDFIDSLGEEELKSHDVATSFAERNYRETWVLEPAPERFYRYYRILGRGEGDECLHGCGLELFGDA